MPVNSISTSLSQPDIIFESSQKGHGFYADSIHIIGFGFDGTACFRKGAKDGPDAIRAVSYGIESYSPYLDRDLEECSLYDLGNLQLGKSNKVDQQWEKASRDLTLMLDALDMKKDNIRLLTLGGEHSISYAPISACLRQFPDLVLLHLDAHADLRDGYEGHHYSHASIIYRVQELFSAGNRLIQYGIRSGTRDEYQWMKQHETLFLSLEHLLRQLDEIDDSRPVYLTLDLDYFDPAYLPGTGTPEAGGEDFHSFVSIIKKLRKKNLVGCDVVELAPSIDQTGNSDVFAAKVVRELILCMHSSGSDSDPDSDSGSEKGEVL